MEEPLTVEELIALLSTRPPKSPVRVCEPGSWEGDRGAVLAVIGTDTVYLMAGGPEDVCHSPPD